jgi:peptidoglycan/xylan/chitin deacetylase (PgdA/CDA1 family)
MMNSAKTLGASLVSATRLHRLLHSQLHRNGLTILMYHGVVREQLPVTDWCFLEDSSFRRQIEYLRRHFSIVSLSAAIELLQQGAVDKPTAVLTFDDGYQNNFDVAFPALQQFGVPATIFLTTGFVDSSNTVWFCHVIRAISETRKPSMRWDDAEFDLSDPRKKAMASARLQAALKERPPAEVGSLVQRICQELDVDLLSSLELGSPFRILNSSSIRTMLDSGLVEFGAHTETHPILSLLSPEVQAREISGSVQAVERLTGQPCRYFAYPNGRPQDYDSRSVELLRNCGILAAVTTTRGSNEARHSLLELQRYGVGADLGMPMFQLLVHHFIR